jgi:CrcB protein
MSPPFRDALLVALGGSIGSVGRYFAVSAFSRYAPGFPFGTLAVNVVGCFLMGVLGGWTEDRALRAALGVGVLGGFTTFSAFGGDTLALAQSSFRLAALNVAANVGLGLAAVWAGRSLVGLLTRG